MKIQYIYVCDVCVKYLYVYLKTILITINKLIEMAQITKFYEDKYYCTEEKTQQQYLGTYIYCHLVTLICGHNATKWITQTLKKIYRF